MTADRTTQALPRQIGIWTALALVIGNVIGSGIFLLPANLAPYGLNAMIGWAVTIAGAICLAAVFGALARALPGANGPYDYIRTTIGELPAFVVMWGYWISIPTGTAAIAIAAVSYLSSLAPEVFAPPGVAAATSVALLLLFTGVACSGARTAGGVQIVTSMLKIVPLAAAILIAVLVLGGGEAPAADVADVPVTAGGVAGAAALTLWAMLGFEAATVPAERVRDPQRTIPRATIIGTLVAGLVYVGASGAVFLLLPASVAAGSSAPFADLIGSYWGPAAATAVVAFAVISCLGALNGWVLLQGEVPLALARRGVFPGWFAAINRRGMPVRAQLTGTGFAAVLIASNYSRGLTDLFGFMALLATVATLVLYLTAAISVLRLIAGGRIRGAGLSVAAMLGAAYATWTFWGAGAEATIWGAVLLASGVPLYILMRRTRGSTQAAAETPA